MDRIASLPDPHGRHPMLDEALDLVDVLRGGGVDLRLVGGLAVLAQCRDPAFCVREHRDTDAVGARRQTKALIAALAAQGYEENRHVRLASAGAELQAYRPCRHGSGGRAAHPDDRIDVYLDAFRLHHELPLRRRLRLEPYTVPLADVLLAKLLRRRLTETDVRDVIVLLKDVALEPQESPGVVGLRYWGQATARDWGLYHDVAANLELVRAGALAAGLAPAEAARVEAAVRALEDAMRRARKGLRWRARALIGERLPWYDVVDDDDAARIGLREAPARSAGTGGA